MIRKSGFPMSLRASFAKFYRILRRFRYFLVFIMCALVLYILGTRFAVQQYFTFSYIKSFAFKLKLLVARHYWYTVSLYMLMLTAFTTLALPITGLGAMIGGFLFPIAPALAYSIISMTVGSVLYVIFARNVFSALLETRYAHQLERFNRRIQHYGYGYLVALHLLVLLPFFVINSLAAITNVPLYVVAWTTALGAIPGTLVYIIAGKELATMATAKNIFTPTTIAILLILATIVIAPTIINFLQKRIRGSR